MISNIIVLLQLLIPLILQWNKKFDDTKESLLNKSHRPHFKHPNAHTDEELKWIQVYHRRLLYRYWFYSISGFDVTFRYKTTEAIITMVTIP